MEDFEYLERMIDAGRKISTLPIRFEGWGSSEHPDDPICIIRVLQPYLKGQPLDKLRLKKFVFCRAYGWTPQPNGLPTDCKSSHRLKDAFNFFTTAISMDFYILINFNHKQFEGLNAVEALERLEGIAENQ